MLIFCHSIWLIKLLCLETFLSHANCHVPTYSMAENEASVHNAIAKTEPIFFWCVCESAFFLFLSAALFGRVDRRKIQSNCKLCKGKQIFYKGEFDKKRKANERKN